MELSVAPQCGRDKVGLDIWKDQIIASLHQGPVQAVTSNIMRRKARVKHRHGKRCITVCWTEELWIGSFPHPPAQQFMRDRDPKNKHHKILTCKEQEIMLNGFIHSFSHLLFAAKMHGLDSLHTAFLVCHWGWSDFPHSPVETCHWLARQPPMARQATSLKPLRN